MKTSDNANYIILQNAGCNIIHYSPKSNTKIKYNRKVHSNKKA